MSKNIFFEKIFVQKVYLAYFVFGIFYIEKSLFVPFSETKIDLLIFFFSQGVNTLFGIKSCMNFCKCSFSGIFCFKVLST